MDWFRLYAEFASDPKVQMMSEAMQRRLVMLMCLQCGNGIETFHETERAPALAFAMRISNDELEETRKVFVRKGFINEDWTLCNWSKRQYASDSSTERVRAYREKKKQQQKRDETLHERSGNALEQNRTEQKEEAYASVGGEAPADLVEQVCSTPVESGPHCDPMAMPAAGDSIATAAPSSCPAEAIIELYHLHMPDNPRCKTLNDARRRAIRARWKEAAKLACKPFGYSNRAEGLKAWAAFFEVCAESDFLTGKAPGVGGRPSFVADIDFLMSPSGFAKTLENKYHREVAA